MSKKKLTDEEKKEKHKEYLKEYREKNRAKIRKKNREWKRKNYAKNKVKVLEENALWRKNNPEKVRESARKTKEKKRLDMAAFRKNLSLESVIAELNLAGDVKKKVGLLLELAVKKGFEMSKQGYNAEIFVGTKKEFNDEKTAILSKLEAGIDILLKRIVEAATDEVKKRI